jgi:hypothetical protein
MEALNREGLARAIGASKRPAPFFQRADYQDLMREHRVWIQSWGGFAGFRVGADPHERKSPMTGGHNGGGERSEGDVR